MTRGETFSLKRDIGETNHRKEERTLKGFKIIITRAIKARSNIGMKEKNHQRSRKEKEDQEKQECNQEMEEYCQEKEEYCQGKEEYNQEKQGCRQEDSIIKLRTQE